MGRLPRGDRPSFCPLADGCSDLYSPSVTLYQMLTGVLPIRGDPMAERMDSIAIQRQQEREEFSRDLRAAAAEHTPVMAAGNAFVSGAATPGYDAEQKDELAPAAPDDNTIVMNKSGAPERPRDGGEPVGQEP